MEKTTKRRQIKVLIVDDNPEMRRILYHFIHPICDDIYECGDGMEALEYYRKYDPDWVLMDWQMEHMDGIAATKSIIEQFPNAHICMITSFDDEDLRAEAVKAGASDFVLKEDLISLRKILTA